MTGGHDPPRPTARAVDDVDAETHRWRLTVLNGLRWTAAAAAIVVTVLSITQGLATWAVPLFVGFAIVIVAVALLPRGSYRLRLGMLLGGIFGLSATGLLTGLLPPNALVAMTVVCLMATMLASKRWGLTFVALGAIAIVASGVLVRTGIVDRPPDWHNSVDPARPPVTIRLAMVFGLVTMLGVLAANFLMTRTETALRERARSLADLEREIAERERMRHELAAQETTFRRARELDLLGRLASYAAHDFNNALLVIQAHCDFARDASPSKEGAASLDAIEAAARQAATTSKQLRAFAPGKSGAARRVRAREQVDRAAHMLGRILPANVTVRSECMWDAFVRLDEGALQGALTNLALNARDAMPNGGTLTLRVREATQEERGAGPARLAIDVEDTGHGMDEATRARAFEPFFTTKGIMGSGLGLPSVREAVSEQGGSIGLWSEPGQGARFTLMWPVDDRAETVVPPPATAPRTGSVLFVEDTHEVRASLQRVMRGAGYSVVEAATADDAITAIRRARRPFDVLLADCIVPGRPLGQLVAEYRAASPHGHVVVCSGYSPAAVLPSDVKVDAFLAKPFTPEVLLSTLNQVTTPAAS